MMRVSAQAMVLGVDSKHAKDSSRIYNKVHLFVPGEDMGAIECGVPEDKAGLLQQLREVSGKSALLTLNIRTYKGTTFVDCVAVQVGK